MSRIVSIGNMINASINILEFIPCCDICYMTSLTVRFSKDSGFSNLYKLYIFTFVRYLTTKF